MLDGPYQVLPSVAVWRVPVVAFAGWDPGEGSTGSQGRGPGDRDGEAAWSMEDEFEAEHVSVPDPWPEGPPDWLEEMPPSL